MVIFLGKYRGQDAGWHSHTVVLKDGRVIDAFSGRTGVPVAEYKRAWLDRELINFGF
ncbi:MULTISPECIES: hypothetical protein [Micromonospora]|uniref:hypothetical protein n=1 Tax=Micromonospora TaxID=1873 RepID=UPI001304D507|nr:MULTISPECIES: hypothetical protein [Micromonospora]WSK45217.1 hypothetical protein OG712_14505 [Micromonospora maris]